MLCHTEDVDRALSECARVLKPKGTLVFSDLVMIGKKTAHSNFYFDFNEFSRVLDSIDQYKKRLIKNGFASVESKDQSKFLKRSLQAGLKRTKANKEEIVNKFGSDKFNSILSYYEQGVRPEFLSEVGWAWFRAVRD